MSIGVGTAPENVDEVLGIVVGELADLGDSGITDRELAIARGNLRAETLLASEDSGARMSRIGASLLLHGEILEVDEILSRLEAVTIDDVRSVAVEVATAPDPCRWSVRSTSRPSMPVPSGWGDGLGASGHRPVG